MRAYLLPAKRLISRVVPQPDGIRSLMYRRRAHVFIIVATFLMLTTAGFMSVRALVADQPEQNNKSATTAQEVEEVKAEGTNVTTTYQSSTSGSDAQQSAGASNNTADAKTSVTVNDQQIPVPENGTVSKTIQNENGTTKVEISSSNTSTGDTNSSSTTTTNLNVRSHTSSSTVDFNN